MERTGPNSADSPKSRLALAMAVTSLALLLVAGACAQVRPWERETLARDDMAWASDPLEAQLRSHVQFSKEGGLVGGGTGGGGCGCN